MNKPMMIALRTLAAFGLMTANASHSQDAGSARVPAEWVAFAEGATASIVAWLEEPGEPATRARAYLDGTRSAPDRATPPIELALWIDADGTVTRLRLPQAAADAAGADFEAAIVGRRLSPPPRGMKLPMRLAIELPPAPAETSAPPQD